MSIIWQFHFCRIHFYINKNGPKYFPNFDFCLKPYKRKQNKYNQGRHKNSCMMRAQEQQDKNVIFYLPEKG